MSPDYYKKIEQNRLLHQDGKAHPGRTRRYFWYLKQIVNETQSKTLLDWGCGRGAQWKHPVNHVPGNPMLKEFLELTDITCYDPAVEEFSKLPPEELHDVVICTDVLSLIPEDDLSWVFQQLRLRCKKALFLVVQSNVEQSNKRYPDGTLKQVTVKSRDWWIKKCQDSANWQGIPVYWKWSEDGRIPDEQLTPVYYQY